MKPAHGFTLIELLVVIAILGILAAAILVAINPNKRMAQARDAQRKTDINTITNALIGYSTLSTAFPTENACDSSLGHTAGAINCDAAGGSNWGTDNAAYIYQGLIVAQAFLKSMPTDPKNNTTHYYKYEPSSQSTTDCTLPSGNPCARYWIGARLEAVDNSTELGKRVFRCSDDTSLAAGAGCVEVIFPSATGVNSFDEYWRIY